MDIFTTMITPYTPDGKVDYQHNSGQIKIQDTKTGMRDLLEEKIMEMSLCLWKRVCAWRREFFILISPLTEMKQAAEKNDAEAWALQGLCDGSLFGLCNY